MTLIDGSTRRIEALSDGTCDLVWLAVRFGILDVVRPYCGGPVLWDEPLARLDDEHLKRVRIDLERLASDRQVILLSRHSMFENWGLTVRIGADTDHQASVAVH